MDIQAYIASGILEAYVHGSLSEQESREVDEMVQTYPEVRQELEEIQQALKVFAASGMAKGPQIPSLESVMDYASNHPFAALTPDIPTPSPDIRPLHPSPSNWMKYALIAASILILVLSTATALFFQRFRQLEQEVAAMQEENAYIAAQYSRMRQQPVVIEPHQHIVADPGSEEISIQGLGAAPDASIKVYWHEPTKDVYLVIERLPEPPTGHQYQLWAVIDGISVDAGIFDHHTKMQKLRTIDGKISAFTVTLEEKGGNPFPNVERTFAKGAVKS